MMNTITLAIFAYILCQVLIGILMSKRMSSESDFILAGRSLGLTMGTFTIFATWFGAETVVSASGEVYEKGLSAAGADPFGYGLALLITGALIAGKLWRGGYITLVDMFRERFGARAERLAVLLFVPGPLIWGAAQVRAFGQVVSSTSGVSIEVAILSAAVVVTLYTLIGGLYASAVTDVLQGVVLIMGLLALGWAVLSHPSVDLGAIPPDRLNPFSGESLGLAESVERWSVAIFSTLISIELLSRVLATRSAETARNATLSAGVVYLLVGLIPLGIGLVAPQLLPHVDEPEQITSLLARDLLRWGGPFPELPFVIFAGALISAILSTVDSVLLSGASALSHNLLVPALKLKSDAAKLLSTRVSVALLCVSATALSLSGLSIHELIEYSSAFGSAGLLTCFLFGLFSRLGGERSALATMGLSVCYWLTMSFVVNTEAPYTLSLALTFITYPLLALLFGERHTLEESALAEEPIA